MEKKTVTIIVIIAVIAVGAYLYINGYIPQINLPFFNSSNNSQAQAPETNNEEENPSGIQPAGSQTYNIELKGFAFNPSSLTIKTGDTIIWENNDSVIHTVTSDEGNELDSPIFRNGETYSHTFSTSGTYPYHCTPHPSMKGVIIVE